MFTVAADTASYIWEKSVDGIAWDTVSNSSVYSGATTDTLEVAGTTATDGMWYRAIAYRATGADTSSPAKLTVIPALTPSTVTGVSRICNGSSTTLMVTTAGGTWTSSDTAVATVSASGVVTSVSPGLDTIRYTLSNSCGSATSNFAITVDSPFVTVPLVGPTTVCVGSFINLSSTNTGASFTWTASNGHATVSASGMVSGVSAGVDTITYTVTNACGNNVTTHVVTVETPIAAGSISGPSVVCAGSVVTFTATVGGGVWLSNNSSVATVDLTGHVTGRGQGTAMISYLFSNSCGSFVAADTLDVDRAASMITGDDSLAIGGSTIFTDSAMGGIWTSMDVTIATIDSFYGVAHGVDTGTVTIVYTVTNSCGTTAMTFLLTVGSPAQVSALVGPDSVCKGTSITLTTTTTDGTWSATNASATVSPTGVVTGVIGGMRDTILFTHTDGFGTTVARKVIYVNAIPVPVVTGPPTVVIGNPYTLVATPTGGTWVSTRPAAVVFISASTFIAQQGDTTLLIYTVSNTCGTGKDTFAVNLADPAHVGINDVTTGTNIMTVSPNPSNGAFSMNIAAAANEIAHVVITNMAGVVVSEMNVTTNTATNVTIAQPAGIYLISALTSNGKYATRIVVAK